MMPGHRDSHHGLARHDAGTTTPLARAPCETHTLLLPHPAPANLCDPTRPSRLQLLWRALRCARCGALRPAPARPTSSSCTYHSPRPCLRVPPLLLKTLSTPRSPLAGTAEYPASLELANKHAWLASASRYFMCSLQPVA
eukprot:4789949-Pleurochrysis_carterae.AAC.3